MLSLSNTLSLLRAPLALALLSSSTAVRLAAIFLAMCSDCLDGYLARKNRTASQFGAILDPAMDKFFVYFALAIFLSEGKLEIWEACAMISRDFFLCLFALYLSCFRMWHKYRYRSIRWGKVSTALQFISLFVLALGFPIPVFVFVLFVVTGFLAFIELFKVRTSQGSK
jgi:phosphatidylglycerophosphate synthase